MSLVGPRPEVPEFVDLAAQDWQCILQVRPGITGPDALEFKDEGAVLAAATDPKACYRQDILPQKMAIQVRYAQERSFAGRRQSVIPHAQRAEGMNTPPQRNKSSRIRSASSKSSSRSNA